MIIVRIKIKDEIIRDTEIYKKIKTKYKFISNLFKALIVEFLYNLN